MHCTLRRRRPLWLIRDSSSIQFPSLCRGSLTDSGYGAACLQLIKEYIAVELRKSTTASGPSASWITISVISIWRRKLCSPSTTPSRQKCYLCLRYILLPTSPGRTENFWLPTLHTFRTFADHREFLECTTSWPSAITPRNQPPFRNLIRRHDSVSTTIERRRCLYFVGWRERRLCLELSRFSLVPKKS
jgi:hypothetical protein